ncbi:hypothetical protein BSZ14_14850 [Sphingomonas sp. Sph1(2015)]|nr:hypothetical protein BSZ14_14850 [Sphingomonas sp. Sph1(2015)]
MMGSGLCFGRGQLKFAGYFHERRIRFRSGMIVLSSPSIGLQRCTASIGAAVLSCLLSLLRMISILLTQRRLLAFAFLWTI